MSENPKTKRDSVKVVGESFKARIYDTKRDALVLVYHPIAHKNRGLKEKLDAFARSADSDKLLVARYSGINESSVFKNPAKLPAILHFSAVDLQDETSSTEEAKAAQDAPFGANTTKAKEQTEYQFTRNHMLKSSSDEDDYDKLCPLLETPRKSSP